MVQHYVEDSVPSAHVCLSLVVYSLSSYMHVHLVNGFSKVSPLATFRKFAVRDIWVSAGRF